MTWTLTSLNTPFGLAMFATREHSGGTVAVLLDEPDPFAAIYAAKSQGVTRVIEAVSIEPIDRLLQPGDILVPDQLVDLTQQRQATFFTQRGYGFLGQHPVWCEPTRMALIASGESLTQRVFKRGVLAVGETTTTPDAAAAWGAHGLALTGVPATFLAKELELCYAVVGIVGGAASVRGNALIAALQPFLPTERFLCVWCNNADRPRTRFGWR